MPYTDPNKVTSPARHWELKKIVYNSGQGGWSVAQGKWDGEAAIGIRWNGSDGEDGNGNPQSRGYATWFILPTELEDALMNEVDLLNKKVNAVSCRIHRPDDYDLGAWRIEAFLSPQANERLGGIPLVFELPKLPRRMLHPDKGYGIPVDKELQGQFVNGSWKGNLYSNGIGEVENPTELDAVKNALIQNVLRTLQKLTN